jgi:hypothetical protein
VLRHDLIKRLIEKMAAFLARLAGLIEARRLDEAEEHLRELERELGLPRGCDALDARSVAVMLGSADQVAFASVLYWHQGEVATERGEVVRAAQLQLRARELYRVVVRGELSPQTLELLADHPLGQR